MLNICVVGTGYVGLVSGVCLAEKGHHVTCVDTDRAKVEKINRGVAPIYEIGLEELLQRNLGSRLRATTDLREAVLQADIVFLAVGTPFDGSEIDLSYVRMASEQIGAVLADKDGYCAVVVRSTVVPGTSDEVVRPILEVSSGKRAGEAFGVGMNPEFLREGQAVQDFLNPGRIVLGGMDERTIALLDQVYAVFPAAEKIRTSSKSAETIKYASNAFFATMISFSNELGNLCAALGGLDIVEVMRGVHLDERLSPIMADGRRVTPAVTTYLEAGCGFGGSCFPKDVNALIAHGRKAGIEMPVLESVMRTNYSQPMQMLRLLKKRFPSLQGLRVALLGVAFKAGTDDIRESPAIPIVRELAAGGAKITAYDPIAQAHAETAFHDYGLRFVHSLEQAVAEVDAVLLVTHWPEFAQLPDLLERMDRQPVLVDGRRKLDKRRVLQYEGIGL